ncbi:MAG: hypothetical protein GWN86_07060 [Desulfobacterales bacterium]|nr:hypothetical protein [Desulfobacterales bacterium]
MPKKPRPSELIEECGWKQGGYFSTPRVWSWTAAKDDPESIIYQYEHGEITGMCTLGAIYLAEYLGTFPPNGAFQNAVIRRIPKDTNIPAWNDRLKSPRRVLEVLRQVEADLLGEREDAIQTTLSGNS